MQLNSAENREEIKRESVSSEQRALGTKEQ